MSLANEQIRALAERVAASHGLEVVDLEFQGGGGKHRTLRIFLERNAEGRAALEQRLLALREVELAGLSERRDARRLDGNQEDGDEEAVQDGSEDVLEEGSIVLDLVEAGEVAGLSPEEDDLAYLRELPSGVPVAQLSGITHGDCERFSKDFGTALDIEDLVPGAEYLLEASSPGLDRKLSTLEEFQRFAGQLCKVQTFTAIEGNRYWQGHLGAASQEFVTLLPVLPKGSKKKKKAGETEAVKVLEIAFGNIEKAQLVPEF